MGGQDPGALSVCSQAAPTWALGDGRAVMTPTLTLTDPNLYVDLSVTAAPTSPALRLSLSPSLALPMYSPGPRAPTLALTHTSAASLMNPGYVRLTLPSCASRACCPEDLRSVMASPIAL